MSKAEEVVQSFMRGNDAHKFSPLLTYDGPYLYQFSDGDQRRNIRKGKITKRILFNSVCIAIRLPGGLIVYKELHRSQAVPMLKQIGAREISDGDFEEIRYSFSRLSSGIERQFPTRPAHDNEKQDIVKALHVVLAKYGIASPYGEDAYDLMRYFNRIMLSDRYKVAFRNMPKNYQNIELQSTPLHVSGQWMFVEDEVDATLLAVTYPFEEKVYLT